PGYIGRLFSGAADRVALSQPAESALAEPWQSRLFLVGGLCMLVSWPATFVPALPLVCRGEATQQGLVVELFISGGIMPWMCGISINAMKLRNEGAADRPSSRAALGCSSQLGRRRPAARRSARRSPDRSRSVLS